MTAARAPYEGARTGKDTRGAGRALAGGVHPGSRTPVLTDTALAEIRSGGLVLPRAPHPGQRWAPRTPAETHLLAEARRLERYRLGLLGEVGHQRAEASALAAHRGAVRGSRPDCPLSPVELEALAAAAAGERLEDTSRRTLTPLSTVKGRRKRAMARLGARSMTHAVALAAAAGWITPRQITRGVSP